MTLVEQCAMELQRARALHKARGGMPTELVELHTQIFARYYDRLEADGLRGTDLISFGFSLQAILTKLELDARRSPE